jgi:protein translocase SecG subunit
MSFAQVITYIQIILSVLLIAGVLLQRSEATLGSAFGGGDSFSSGFHTKRGPEKALFIFTIVVSVLFVLSSFSLLII